MALDPGRVEHLDQIYRCARRRAPISRRFSVLNPKLVLKNEVLFAGIDRDVARWSRC